MQISNLKTSNLESLTIENVPREFQYIIDELNILLARIRIDLEDKNRFAANAAHELKTPLAALKTQAQVGLNTNNISAKNQALKKIISSADYSNNIIKQLLTISKLTTEENIYSNWQMVDLNNLAKETLTSLAPNAIKNNIELELISTNNLSKFYANSTNVSILIKNLVENAINYSYPKGQVTVKTYQDKENIILEVADNGPGIAPELYNKVFARFYRTPDNQKPGSGLGLAIVQEIINQLNAKITLNSAAQGTGLIVRVFFGIKTMHMRNDK